MRAVPVVVVSGDRDVERRIATANTGYIEKPLRTERLFEMLEQLSR